MDGEPRASEGLKELVERQVQAARLRILTAQTKLLQGPREAVADAFSCYPPGWSLYCRRGSLFPSASALRRAERTLNSTRSPIPSALRELHQSDSDHDRRFLELLWEDRPKLVAAVALYSSVASDHHHPDMFRRMVVEPRFEAAVRTLEGELAEGRLGSEELVQAICRYSDTREESKSQYRYLSQLFLLGWGGWRVPKGELEPTSPKGGGEPMPCWILSAEPAELDGQLPDDLSKWWSVNAPSDDERKGKTIFTYTVSAILDALELRNRRNDREHRRQVAAYIPDVFGEERRDPSPDGMLKQTVGSVQRRG